MGTAVKMAIPYPMATSFNDRQISSPMPSKPSASLCEKGLAKYFALSVHVVMGEGKSLELVLASHVAQDRKHHKSTQMAMPMDGKATLSMNIFFNLVEIMVAARQWSGVVEFGRERLLPNLGAASSAGASLSHWNLWPVVFSLPLA